MDALELTHRTRCRVLPPLLVLLLLATGLPTRAQAPPPTGTAARLGIDEHAPLRLRDSVLVQASPARVWATLTDIARWPTHYDFVTATVPPTALQAGARFHWRTPRLRITSTLLLAEAPHRLGWRGGKYGVKVYHFWRLRPQGSATWVVSEESQRGLPVRLLRGRFEQRLREGTRSWLNQLRVAAEAPIP